MSPKWRARLRISVRNFRSGLICSPRSLLFAQVQQSTAFGCRSEMSVSALSANPWHSLFLLPLGWVSSSSHYAMRSTISHCLDADGAYPLQKVYDLLLVVGEPVGVEPFGDGGILWLLFLVLVQYPFQAVGFP